MLETSARGPVCVPQAFPWQAIWSKSQKYSVLIIELFVRSHGAQILQQNTMPYGPKNIGSSTQSAPQAEGIA